MPFDLTIWKERFQEKIIQLGLKAHTANHKSLHELIGKIIKRR